MPTTLGPVATPEAQRVFERPVRARGPEGPWAELRAGIEEHGSALAYAHLEDWLPDDLEDPGLRGLLGPDYARFSAMTHPQVRSRFVASRLMLKYAACAVIGAEPHGVELAYKPGGRPYLRGMDQLDISLSHTDSLLLVGLTRRGWIGVDAELKDRPMLGRSTERQVCTPYECEALELIADEHRNGALVRLWTLKEAYSKAIGQGMRFRFTEFGFQPEEQGSARVLRPDGSPGHGAEWTFHTCLLERRYTVSVALFERGFGERHSAESELPDEQGLLAALGARQERRT